MLNSVLTAVVQYGYPGLFCLLMLGIVGLPVPDETLLMFSGYLISQKKLHAGWTFVAAFGGSTCGISLSYLIGRSIEHQFLERYGKYVRLTPARLAQVHDWFERIGDWLLAVGYFIPGVRHFTALVAGMSKLEFSRFAAFAYTGAAVWVAIFLGLGFWLSDKWQIASELIHKYTLECTIAACAILAGGWWVKTRLLQSRPN